MNDLASRLILDSVLSHSPDVVARVARGEAVRVLAEQDLFSFVGEMLGCGLLETITTYDLDGG